MAQHEPVDPLLELDSLLKQELAVSPSPEFLPRVREAVRLEPGPARWPRLLWVLTPMAAAAVILLAIFLRPLWTIETMPLGGTRAADVQLAAPPPSAAPLRAARFGGQAPSPRVARSGQSDNGQRTTGNGYPVVIVDQHQRAALMSMIRMINEGHLTGESFKDTREPPIEIGVEPVAVSPIVAGGVLPSEGERK